MTEHRVPDKEGAGIAISIVEIMFCLAWPANICIISFMSAAPDALLKSAVGLSCSILKGRLIEWIAEA